MGAAPGTRRTDDDRSIEGRYRRAREELVPRFLERHRLTRAGLADLLGVDRSAFSRFLNAVAGYTPSRSRPGKMEILERIEAECTKLNIRTRFDELATRGEHDVGPDGDAEVWFRNFSERLGTFEDKYEPATAVALLPELCAQALAAPSPYGPSMATNLLLTVTGHVDRVGIEDASASLLRHTAERVRRLEASALERGSATFHREAAHKPTGYAGYALAMIGLVLDDGALVEEGMERLERAAFAEHEFVDGHDVNLLMVLERMLETGHERGDAWSERVALKSLQHPSDHLRAAHATRAFDHVRRHWTAVAPDLIRRIDAKE